MTAVLHAVEVDVIRTTCEVPVRRTVTEWADSERILPETSTAPGPYRSSVVPYARRPQDLTADPSVELIVLCWASQTGKSTVIENAIGYRIQHQPCPIVGVQPKQEMAEGWVKERFVPMVRATPALRKRKVGLTADSTLRFKRFAGGFLFVASAQSASELASRPAPFVCPDEVDRYEDIPGEGNPLEIVARRMGAADIGQRLMTSTPADKEDSLIWPYLEGGTYELYHVPCPLCGHRQALEWARLKWEADRPETAQYECAGCAERFDDSTKAAMLAGGGWVASRPGNPYPSFHLNGLYSPFGMSSWGHHVEHFLRARHKPADLQVFVNTVLAEPWEDKGERIEGSVLVERLEPYEIAVVPEGVGALTGGVDVQGHHVEVSIWGWGADLESWLILHEVIPGDPALPPTAEGSPWPKVDEALLRAYPHANGASVPVSASFVDSGYLTSSVYKYTRPRQSRKVFSSKGVPGNTAIPIIGKPSTPDRERTILYPVGTDKAKTEFLRSQIHTRAPGPGYVHLPDWVSTEWLDQLVAEKRITRIVKGRHVYEWHKVRRDTRGEDVESRSVHNESLDCRIYARAALEALGARTIAKLGELAKKLAVPVTPTVTPPPSPQEPTLQMPTVPRPRRGGGFIGGWNR